jgi:hypothetical protein
VIILSERPSLPPGDVLQALGEACRGDGSVDYCVVVFRRGGRIKYPRIEFAKPRPRHDRRATAKASGASVRVSHKVPRKQARKKRGGR